MALVLGQAGLVSLVLGGQASLVSLVLGWQAGLALMVLGPGFQKMVWEDLSAGHQEEWLAPLALNDLGQLDC